jgi:hypothetical protein
MGALSALALPSARTLSGLTLAPSALWLPCLSTQLFAHALIPHAGKEQDLCAAVSGSHATATAPGRETDDIVHKQPPQESVERFDSSSISKCQG